MNSHKPCEIILPEIGRARCIGNQALLSEPRAAILNSRQGKFPAPNAPWLGKTLEAAAELVHEGQVVVSSVGMFTWELVTWKGGACGGKVIIVVPGKRKQDTAEIARNISNDFALDLERTLLFFPENGPQQPEFLEGFPSRDRWIIALADRLYPISIRSRGNLAQMIERLSNAAKVETKFAIPYANAERHSWLRHINIIHPTKSPLSWGYLTHWTRATASPWPGETRAEFYSSFDGESSEYPRSGFHTLRRILSERRIRASKQLIRGEQSVVSLTACLPWELTKLVKWRPSLLRWTFEPYGIALSREKLSSLGARPVIYSEDYQYRFLQEMDRPFFQSGGHDKNDWNQEQEWRHIGDLDLSQFSLKDVLVFTLTEEEANLLRNESCFPVMSWLEMSKKLGLGNRQMV